MAPMVRKQIYLTPSQNARLRQSAARQRRSEAEVLRDALERHLGEARPTRPRLSEDPLWGIVGVGASREGDLSELADDYQYPATK